MKGQKIRIVVLGAGYAGMMAALRLSGKTRMLGTEIILVNGIDSFVERPRLHQVATSQTILQKPLSTMLSGTRVQFLQGWVSAVNPKDRRVTVRMTHGIEQVNYDYLVYALGSVVNQEGVRGVHEHAYVLDPQGPNATGALREKLQALSQTEGRAIIIGGGATGIECATQLKGQFPNLQVSVVTDGVFGAFKGPRVLHHFREALAQQDIKIYEQRKVQAVEAGQIAIIGGEKFPFDLCLWSGGFRALPLARDAGFKVNDRGQILTDPFGRSISHPDVYAVGDASHPIEEPGVPMRMSLFTALIRGAHAADNITSHLQGKPQTPLSLVYYGQGIAMGLNDGVGFLGLPDDLPHGPILRGRLAVQVRNFFVWMILYFLELERLMPGFFFWLGKGRYSANKRSHANKAGLKTQSR